MKKYKNVRTFTINAICKFSLESLTGVSISLEKVRLISEPLEVNHRINDTLACQNACLLKGIECEHRYKPAQVKGCSLKGSKIQILPDSRNGCTCNSDHTETCVKTDLGPLPLVHYIKHFFF